MIVIANFRDNLSSLVGYEDIRIDRSSKLGNPYDLKDKDNTDHRRKVVIAYKKWFKANLSISDTNIVVALDTDLLLAKNRKNTTVGEFKQELRTILRKILDGKNIRLMCWCYPKECHGEVVRDYLEKYVTMIKNSNLN